MSNGIPQDVWQSVISTIFENNSYIKSSANMFNDYTDIALIEFHSSGSNGGNYYGDRTASYTVDDYERVSSIREGFGFLEPLKNYIKSGTSKDEHKYLRQIDDMVTEHANNMTGDYIDQYTTSTDYYGNYSEYRIVGPDILKFMEELLTEEDLKQFIEVYEDLKPKEEHRLLVERNTEQYKTVVTNINNFEKTAESEKIHLENRIEHKEKELKNLKKDLAQFEKTNTTKKQHLEKTKTQLEEFFKEHDIDISPQKKNKLK